MRRSAEEKPGKKKEEAGWVPRGWEMGWMTIDWLSTLIWIRTSFRPDTLSWQAAMALTYEDVDCRPCSTKSLLSCSIYTRFSLIDLHCQKFLCLGKKTGNLAMNSGLKSRCGFDWGTSSSCYDTAYDTTIIPQITQPAAWVEYAKT